MRFFRYYFEIGMNVFVSGGCNIEDSVYLAPGAMIRDKIHVHKSSIIGMGAVVLRNVRESAIMVGNPAKRIGVNENNKVFDMFGLD